MIAGLRDLVRGSRLAGPLADTALTLRRPLTMRRLLADARVTREEAAFARGLPRPAADAPLLLLLSMTNNPYGAKVESMLALALRRRGWRTQVLTSRLYTIAHRIFEAYGIRDLVPFEDMPPPDRDAMAAGVDRLAGGPMDFQSVLRWTYRGAWIGPQLLSSVSRQAFDGAPDPRDPRTQAALIARLPVSLRFVHAAEGWMESNAPDHILVNEPNFHVLGPFVDVAIARNIPTVHFVQPSRDDALVFKRLTRATRRIHPNSIAPETLDSLLAEPWTNAHQAALDDEFGRRYGGAWRIQERNQPGVIDLSPGEIRAELSVASDRPVAVVFSHVLWDANLFYGEDVFENYGHWFIETVKAAVANPRATWLIKLHPANLWKRKLSGKTGEFGELSLLRTHIGALPNHVRILPPDTHISSLSLFRMIDVGITVRGSIGYELPCFGVPVVTAGTGRYSGFGFTLDHANRSDYLATLAKIETLPRLAPEAILRAKVHAHALFVRRPWLFSSFAAETGDDPRDMLCQNLHPRVRSHDEISRTGDLDTFADWIERTRTVDYLASQR